MAERGTLGGLPPEWKAAVMAHAHQGPLNRPGLSLSGTGPRFEARPGPTGPGPGPRPRPASRDGLHALIQKLRRVREQRRLSQSDVAERSGLNRSVVSSLENGRSDNPTIDTLLRYAAAVGLRLVLDLEDAGTTDRA